MLLQWFPTISSTSTVASDGQQVKGIVILLATVAALAASVAAGTPSDLPGVAMGWPLLFHVQRAAALLGAIGIVFLVGWRAAKGEFPVKFGNVEYEAKQAVVGAEEAAADQEERIRLLEVLAGVRDPRDLDLN